MARCLRALCEVLTGSRNRQAAPDAPAAPTSPRYRARRASGRIRAGGGDPAGRRRVGGRVLVGVAERSRPARRVDARRRTSAPPSARSDDCRRRPPCRRPPCRPLPRQRRPTTNPATSAPIEPVEPTLGVGDALYPGLGSSDIDVVAYDVALTYDPVTDRLAGNGVDRGRAARRRRHRAARRDGSGDRQGGGRRCRQRRGRQQGDELLVELPEPMRQSARTSWWTWPTRRRDAAAIDGDRVPRRLVRHRRRLVRAERARRCQRVAPGVRPSVRQGDVAVRDHRARGHDGRRQRRSARRDPRRRRGHLGLGGARTDDVVRGPAAHRRLRGGRR